jgi:hypothetical protein
VIRKLVRAVARAAVAQPWDYQGDGAPDDWEFRVSPDEKHVALYDPGRDHWVLLDSGRLTVVAEVRRNEMDENTEDWRQFVSVEDPDD